MYVLFRNCMRNWVLEVTDVTDSIVWSTVLLKHFRYHHSNIIKSCSCNCIQQILCRAFICERYWKQNQLKPWTTVLKITPHLLALESLRYCLTYLNFYVWAFSDLKKGFFFLSECYVCIIWLDSGPVVWKQQVLFYTVYCLCLSLNEAEMLTWAKHLFLALWEK